MIQRWINWNYVLPRAAVTVAALLVVWVAVEPVVHGFLVGIGQRIVGAKVEIQSVDVSVTGCDFTLEGVRIAHPRDSLRNLLECDAAAFDVQSRSVLHRRLVVKQAHLRGVRFNTPRTTSGKVDLPSLGGVDVPDEFTTRLEALSKRALRQFVRLVAQDLREDLISIQLLQELAARWPQEVRQLEARAQAVRGDIEKLRDDVASTSNKPARAVASISERINEVERLRGELADIRQTIDRLVQDAGRDRIAIEVAQRHDYETIKRKYQVKSLDLDGMSEYLLGDDLSAHVSEMLAWIKLARRYWPSDVEMPPGERSHGTDILFAGVKPFPRALVQRMILEGTFHRGDRTIPWQGQVLNLTTDPAIVGKPMIVRAKTGGDRPLAMEAILDRTGQTPRDQIVVSIPRLPQPERLWGDEKELALQVAKGDMVVWAEMQLDGEALAGKVILQQKDLQLRAKTPPEFGARLQTALGSALQSVHHLQAEVQLSGTLDKPRWGLKSNLGDHVAAGIRRALEAELADRQQEAIVWLDNTLAREQQAFDQAVTSQRQRLLEQLDLAQQQAAVAREAVAGRIQLPGGVQLPQINPFGLR